MNHLPPTPLPPPFFCPLEAFAVIAREADGAEGFQSGEMASNTAQVVAFHEEGDSLSPKLLSL